MGMHLHATLQTDDIYTDATRNLRSLLTKIDAISTINYPLSASLDERVQIVEATKSTREHLESELAALPVSLAKQDLPGALTWAENLPKDIPQNSRLNMLGKILDYWVKTDPASTANYAFKHNQNSNSGFDPQTLHVVSMWAQQDYKAALAWAETLPPGETREDCMASALDVMAKTDPAGAFNHAFRYAIANQKFIGFNSIIYTWSETDPASAARALASLPEGALGQLADNTANLLITNWWRRDRAAVVQWLTTLPQGALRVAAEASVNQWAKVDALSGGGGGVIASTGQTVFVFQPGGGAVAVDRNGVTSGLSTQPSSGNGQFTPISLTLLPAGNGTQSPTTP